MARSMANSSSMRRTISAAIGALASLARSKKSRLPCAQHAASTTGAGLRSVGVEGVVAGKRVGLHDARPGGEDFARILAMTGRRVIEHRRRRSLAAERPIVAHDRPRACRCASWSWRAPSRSCRPHAGARRRARAGEARRGWDRGRRRIRRPSRRASRRRVSTPSRAKAALWRFSGRWSPNLPTRIMASRLGPAKPRGIGCDGAGGSVTPSQSRQANFSRTRSMIFQRRGSHSSVLDTTSPSLRSRAPPHLPQTHGAGSTMRSTGRLSGSLRGPRGARRLGALAVSGAAISALVSSSACVSSRSSIASSSCSTRSLLALRRLAVGLAARLGQL